MRTLFFALTAGLSLAAGAAAAEDLRIALIYGRTGPLEAYAKQTETGLRMGFEYATKGSMKIDGRNIDRFELLAACCGQVQSADEIYLSRMVRQMVANPAGPLEKIRIVARESQ